MIQIKRVYDQSDTDGTRLLVERLWPRGVKKTSLEIKVGSRMWHPAGNCGNGSAMIQRSGMNFVAAISPNLRPIQMRGSQSLRPHAMGR